MKQIGISNGYGKRVFEVLKRGSLVLGVCASMAVGSLGVGSAEARMPEGDPVSGHAIQCKWIQDQYDDALQNLKNAKTNENYATAAEQMHSAMDAWRAEGCHKDYGNIAIRVAVNNTATTHAVDAAQTGVVDPGAGPNPHVVAATKTAGVIAR